MHWKTIQRKDDARYEKQRVYIEDYYQNMPRDGDCITKMYQLPGGKVKHFKRINFYRWTTLFQIFKKRYKEGYYVD